MDKTKKKGKATKKRNKWNDPLYAEKCIKKTKGEKKYLKFWSKWLAMPKGEKTNPFIKDKE